VGFLPYRAVFPVVFQGVADGPPPVDRRPDDEGIVGHRQNIECPSMLDNYTKPPLKLKFLTHEAFDFELFSKVIRGDLAVYMARNVLSLQYCREATERFRNHPMKSSYQFRDPSTPRIHVVGKSMYDYPTLGDYFAEAGKNQDAIDKVDGSLIPKLWETLRARFQSNGLILRPLEKQGRQAVGAVWREWPKGALIHNDDFDIHDEEPDFSDRRVKGGRLSSFSFCISQAEEGGDTVLYNQIPDGEDFEHRVGDYGFHPRVVENAPRLSFRANSGDAYIFNSTLLHEVKPVQGPTPRITRNTFCAQKGKEILYWQ